MKQKKPNYRCAAIALPLLFTSIGQAATLMWSDSYNTSANSLDSRFERSFAFTRQYFNPASGIPSGTVTAGIGVLTPTYPTSQGTDFRDQILGAPTNGYLQLTGDNYTPVVSPNSNGIATLAPFYNFDGFTTGGEVLGKQIQFTLDMFTNTPGSNSYSHAAFTVGSLATNGLSGRAESGTAAAGFSVRFVEDQFGATPNGNFIQFYDGVTLVANLLANPAGAGTMTVILDINDTDGNPWDGLGATTIDVTVNSTVVGSYTKTGGGYTDNVMTMEGSANFVGFGAGEHKFDNLQVFSAAVPEPSASILGGLGALALLRRRRN